MIGKIVKCNEPALPPSIGILLELSITFTKNYMVKVFDMAEHKLK